MFCSQGDPKGLHRISFLLYGIWRTLVIYGTIFHLFERFFSWCYRQKTRKKNIRFTLCKRRSLQHVDLTHNISLIHSAIYCKSKPIFPNGLYNFHFHDENLIFYPVFAICVMSYVYLVELFFRLIDCLLRNSSQFFFFVVRLNNF